MAVTDAHLENLSIEDFDIGVHVEDWVRGMRFVGYALREKPEGYPN